MRNGLYTLLTWAICVVATLRRKLCGAEHELRWDRTLPWDEPELDSEKGVVYLQCCDCGLTHFLIFGESVTPERPKKYAYHFRAGKKVPTLPNPTLGKRAQIKFQNWCEEAA